jgi:cell division protein FtsB
MRGNTIAVIALVMLVLAAGAFGYLFYNSYNLVARADAPKGLRFQLDDAEVTLRKELDRLKAEEAKLAASKTKLDAELARYREADSELHTGEIRQTEAIGAKDYAEGWTKAVTDKNEMVEGRSKAGVADYKGRKDEAEKGRDQRIKDITEERGKIAQELEKYKKEIDALKNKLKGDETKLRNVRNDKEQDVAALVTREDPVGLPYVGRVLKSDPEHDLAVVSLGSRHGVKPGMRFEVVQIRGGNSRVHKGYLEVKTVTPEVSTCSIVIKEVRLRRCGVCSYTAEEPEQRFCPRCTAPGSTQGAQPLGDPKLVVRGKSLTDPIVEGDLLYNPFFSPGQKRRYAISGRALVEGRDFGTDAIRHAVEFHGNQVDERLSAATDVLIRLREGEDVTRARQLGIVIVNGFDLFRFLER